MNILGQIQDYAVKLFYMVTVTDWMILLGILLHFELLASSPPYIIYIGMVILCVQGTELTHSNLSPDSTSLSFTWYQIASLQWGTLLCFIWISTFNVQNNPYQESTIILILYIIKLKKWNYNRFALGHTDRKMAELKVNHRQYLSRATFSTLLPLCLSKWGLIERTVIDVPHFGCPNMADSSIYNGKHVEICEFHNTICYWERSKHYSVNSSFFL